MSAFQRAQYAYDHETPPEYSRGEERLIEQAEARAANEFDCAASGVAEEVVGLLSESELHAILSAWMAKPSSGHASAIHARVEARDLLGIVRERYIERAREQAIESIEHPEPCDDR